MFRLTLGCVRGVEVDSSYPPLIKNRNKSGSLGEREMLWEHEP